MLTLEQRRSKIIPATFEASQGALVADENIGRRRRPKLIWTKQHEDLFPIVHTGYYPGSDMDMFPIDASSHELFLRLYDGYDEATQRRMGTRDEYSAMLDERLNNPEPQTKHKLWGEGIIVFSRALVLTAKHSKLEVPRLSDHILDAYDKVLVDPKTTQTEDEERVLFRLHLDEIQEKSLEETDGYAVSFSPMARLRSPEMAERIKDAVWNRAVNAEEVEPDFTRAVDSYRTFDTPTHRQFFLAGAALVHDLFDLHYQIEQLKTETGLK